MTITDCNGTVVESGLTLESGSSGFANVCLQSHNDENGEGYTITVGGGGWVAEVSWSLVHADVGTVMQGGVGTVSTCGTQACVTGSDIHMTDTWGDGWNGNLLTVSDCAGNFVVSGVTLDAGNAGTADLCIDPSYEFFTVTVGGGNYASEVSWELINSEGVTTIQGGVGSFTTCPTFYVPSEDSTSDEAAGSEGEAPCVCCDNDWDLHLADYYGDGWNGNMLSVADCSGNILASGMTLWSGSSGSSDVCLEVGDPEGYTIEVGGGSYQSEVSWTLTNAEGEDVVAGGAGTVTTCEETVEDVLEEICEANDWDMRLTDTENDGWGANTMTISSCDGEIITSGLTMESGGSFNVDVCLPPAAAGGYIIEVGGGIGSWQVGWTLYAHDGTVFMEGGAGVTSTCDTSCGDLVIDGWDIHMIDAYGDGWNAAQISVTTCDGTVLQSGITLESGADGFADICIPPTEDTGGGYVVTVTPGQNPYQVAWELVNVDGEIALSGGPGTVSTCPFDAGNATVCQEGCTDVTIKAIVYGNGDDITWKIDTGSGGTPLYGPYVCMVRPTGVETEEYCRALPCVDADPCLPPGEDHPNPKPPPCWEPCPDSEVTTHTHTACLDHGQHVLYYFDSNGGTWGGAEFGTTLGVVGYVDPLTSFAAGGEAAFDVINEPWVLQLNDEYGDGCECRRLVYPALFCVSLDMPALFCVSLGMRAR